MIHPLPLDDDTRAALSLAATTLNEAMQQAQPYAICQAMRQSARAHAAVLALPVAEGELQQALRWAQAAGATDLSVDVLCDLCDMTELWSSAEEQQGEGEGRATRERMRGYAYECGALAGAVSDPAWEIQVLLRLARAFERCGDGEDAELMKARAIQRMEGSSGPLADPHQMPGLGRLADA